jgi:AAA15 family ATPase/GTPase
MIISLKIENYRSIKDELFIDFKATNRLNEDHLPNNIFSESGFSLLSSIILYGRNASGKSNILKAIKAINFLIEKSMDFKHKQRIPSYEPFKFDMQTKDKPIKLDVEFISVGSKVRYNYLIFFSEFAIEKESLYFYPQGVKAKLYERINNQVSYGEYYKGAKKSIEDELLENQLFLSKASTSKIDYLNEVFLYFTKYFFVSTIHDTEYDKTIIRAFSEYMLDDNKLKSNILKLLKAGDTNITDFNIIKNDTTKFKFPDNISEEIQKDIIERFKYDVKTEHLMFNKNELIGKESIPLEDESFGTKKLLSVGSLIISTLEDGGVLVVDELDKGLHPLLTKLLIKLFHSRTNNPHNAQLIFATHDSTLLDNDLFRRDQICFVDKEYEGGSVFYKLSDMKGIRKDIPIDRWYLSGRYKAIPVISDLTLEF